MSGQNPKGRPLIISDCDEVLLHMVAPFRDWLGEDAVARFDPVLRRLFGFEVSYFLG